MFRTKFSIITLVFGVGLLMGSCSDSEWKRADKKKLMKRCLEEGGSNAYCKCYLSNAMEAYPNAKDMDELDFESSVELSIGCE